MWGGLEKPEEGPERSEELPAQRNPGGRLEATVQVTLNKCRRAFDRSIHRVATILDIESVCSAKILLEKAILGT